MLFEIVGRIVLEAVPADETIVGRVVRPDGQPAAGARIAYEARASHDDGYIDAETGVLTWNQIDYQLAP